MTDYAKGHPLHGAPEEALEAARSELRGAVTWKVVTMLEEDIVQQLADAIVASYLDELPADRNHYLVAKMPGPSDAMLMYGPTTWEEAGDLNVKIGFRGLIVQPVESPEKFAELYHQWEESR